MAHGDVITTDAQIDAARERGKKFDRHPRVLSINFEPSIDAFSLKLSTGRRYFIPREDLDGLEGASQSQLADIDIYSGLSLAWPQLDVDHYFPYILSAHGNPDNWFHSEKPLETAHAETTQAIAA